MSKNVFQLKSKIKPAGDQPKAILALNKGLTKELGHQTLLGVTGSGKTFTMANVIAAQDKPVLVIAHNKTLAAQLAQEYRDFFPDNAVHYFVSYYDYYQPEAYVVASDTYIEKDASINEEIERLRHASTQALLTRRDVVIVASVSCIYGLGSPSEYAKSHLFFKRGDQLSRSDLIRRLVEIYYERTNADLLPGQFRAIGNSVEVMPPGERAIVNIKIEGDKVTEIIILDAVSRAIVRESKETFFFPAKHFITQEDERNRAIISIKAELEKRLVELNKEGKILEAERLKRRTNYDLAMIREVGYCNGIENYSRHLSGRAAGEAPATLLDYFPRQKDGSPDFLTIIDESHVTVPQIRGMYAGDESRKKTLVEHGFRLPSALDNRPLKFPEFQERIGQVIYTSATPSEYEISESRQAAQEAGLKPELGIVEQIIRPTGLVDPKVTLKPLTGQIDDLIHECRRRAEAKERVLVTTLTKRTAEELTDYLREIGIQVQYLHSEIDAIERVEILRALRKGEFDVLVGINLLREGLDLPEVSLVAILDADKEGFLRSETSLIQTAGRAARHLHGEVILYADIQTQSIQRFLAISEYRRQKQLAYNAEHHITPRSVNRAVEESLSSYQETTRQAQAMLAEAGVDIDLNDTIRELEEEMLAAANNLEFEKAALLRDQVRELRRALPDAPPDGKPKPGAARPVSYRKRKRKPA